MKEETKTKKDLIKELKSLQRKVNHLEKANLILKNNQDEKIRLSKEIYHNVFDESFDGLFITSPEGKISSYSGVIRDISKREQFEKVSCENEDKHCSIFKNSINAIFLTESDGRILAANPEACRIFERTEPEFCLRGIKDIFDTTDPRVGPAFEELRHIGRFKGELTFVRKDCTIFSGLIVSNIFPDNDGNKKISILIYDITDRKQAEEALRQSNRELHAMSNCNQVLLRAIDEQTLLNEICRIICEEAGYSMAWVGYAEKDEVKTICPVARAGGESGYIANLNLSRECGIESGQDIAERVIRSGKISYVQDFTCNPQEALWQKSFLRHEYRSGITLPLKEENTNAFGILQIYSKEPNVFTPNEIRLLEKLSSDLAFGITALRNREKRKHTEAALEESETKYRNLVENSLAGVYFIQDNIFRYVNKRFCKIFGYTYEEIVDKMSPIDTTHPDDKKLVEGNIQKRLTGKTDYIEYEFRSFRKDGSIISVRVLGSYIYYQNKPTLVGTIIDVTEQKQAEEKLIKSEALLRTLVDTIPDLIWLKDADGVYLQCNQRFEKFFGANEEEIAGKTDYDFMDKKAADVFWRYDKAAIAAGKPTMNEEQVTFSDRHKEILETTKTPIFGRDGRFIGVLGISHDITERKNTEKELRENQRFLSALLGNLSGMVYKCKNDINWTMEFVSEGSLALTGYTPEQLLDSKTIAYGDLIHPNDREMVWNLVQGSIKTKQSYRLEYRIIDASGIEKWVWEQGSNIYSDTGDLISLEGFITDVTDRKKVESIILQSEKRFKEMANLLPQTLYESDINGNVTFANETALTTFGYSLDDITMGLHMLNMVSEKDRTEAQENIQRILAGLSPNKNEYEMVKKDGTVFPALTFSGPIIRDGKSIGFRGTIVDITHQKITENELRKLSEAVAQSPVLIVITNIHGNIEYVNKTFEETTGYSFSEVVNHNPRILKSGYTKKEVYKALWDTVTSGKTWRGELLNKKKNGELYWEDALISPIKDKEGNTIYYLAEKQDITEKRKMTEELIAAKEQAERSDKLKSEFLAQMSHEIRTPMNVTVNFANLIKEVFYDKIDNQTAKYFEGIELASKRLIRTVDLILNISELQVGAYSPTFENVDLMKDIFNNLTVEFEAFANQKKLKLIVRSSVSKPNIYCDIYSVNQIFTNLIDNAIKYTHKGKVEITIENIEDRHVKVIVSDTGIGISEEFMRKMFEPFMQEEMGYSRKYEGNGLGLALVKKYCDLNKAVINVESEKDKGSKFTITFLQPEYKSDL